MPRVESAQDAERIALRYAKAKYLDKLGSVMVTLREGKIGSGGALELKSQPQS